MANLSFLIVCKRDGQIPIPVSVNSSISEDTKPRYSHFYSLNIADTGPGVILKHVVGLHLCL